MMLIHIFPPTAFTVWVFIYVTSCDGLSSTGSGRKLRTKKIDKDSGQQHQGMLEFDDDANLHPPGRPPSTETATAGEDARMHTIGIAAGGQLSTNKASNENDTGPFFFQVHHETPNSTALMEEALDEFEEDIVSDKTETTTMKCADYATNTINKRGTNLRETNVALLMGFGHPMIYGDDGEYKFIEDESQNLCHKNSASERCRLDCAEPSDNGAIIDKKFLTKWRLSTANSIDQLKMTFKCCQFGAEEDTLGDCAWYCTGSGGMGSHNKVTNFGAGVVTGQYAKHVEYGEGKCDMEETVSNNDGSLMNLINDEISVDCPLDQGLTSFFMENSTESASGRQLRFRFKCCKMAEGKEISFRSEEFTEIKTESHHQSEKISHLAAHNVECPGGTVMNGWHMKDDGGQFYLVAKCLHLASMPVAHPPVKCHFVGDPHFKCEGPNDEACTHDPMSPRGQTGFYWVIKNDVIQVQAYYQGKTGNAAGTEGEPMRVKGLAFGGKSMFGCKLIIKHNTNVLSQPNGIVRERKYKDPQDRRTSICWCDPACTCVEQTDMSKVYAYNCDSTVAGPVHTGNVLEGNVLQGQVLILKQFSSNRDEATVHASLPMSMKLKMTHIYLTHGSVSYSQVNELDASQLPGNWGGHCGSWTPELGSTSSGADDQWCIREDKEQFNMFWNEYTGVRGAEVAGSGGATSMQDCADGGFLQAALQICGILFPAGAAGVDPQVSEIYKKMCVLDECATKGEEEKADVSNDDKETELLELMNADDASPIFYAVTDPPKGAHSRQEAGRACVAEYGSKVQLAQPRSMAENMAIAAAAEEQLNKDDNEIDVTHCLRLGIELKDGKWRWMKRHLSSVKVWKKRMDNPDADNTNPRESECDIRCPNQAATPEADEFCEDCWDTYEIGPEFDHLWEPQSLPKFSAASKTKTVACLSKSNYLWYATEDFPDATAMNTAGKWSSACEGERRYSIVTGATGVTARGVCGANKELAMPQSLREIANLKDSNLLIGVAKVQTSQNSKPQDETEAAKVAAADSGKVYIGGAFFEGSWTWDNGHPMRAPANAWVNTKIPTHDDHPNGAYLCLKLPEAQFEACSGLDVHPMICQQTAPLVPCPLSEFPLYQLRNPNAGTLGYMDPAPLKAIQLYGHCYYMGKHQASCRTICETSLMQPDQTAGTIVGFCDHRGDMALKSDFACQMAISAFKLDSGNMQTARGKNLDVAYDQRIGCNYDGSTKTVQVKLPTDDKGHSSDSGDCDARSGEHEHRVCACTTGRSMETWGAAELGSTLQVTIALQGQFPPENPGSLTTKSEVAQQQQQVAQQQTTTQAYWYLGCESHDFKDWSCDPGSEVFYVDCNRILGGTEPELTLTEKRDKCYARCSALGAEYTSFAIYDKTACMCKKETPQVLNLYTKDVGCTKAPVVGCDETLKGHADDGYRGCQHHSRSDRLCQKWTVQVPHTHTRTPENYPDKGLGDHNQCRNPDDEEETVWCYTVDPGSRWEYCNPLTNPVIVYTMQAPGSQHPKGCVFKSYDEETGARTPLYDKSCYFNIPTATSGVCHCNGEADNNPQHIYDFQTTSEEGAKYHSRIGWGRRRPYKCDSVCKCKCGMTGTENYNIQAPFNFYTCAILDAQTLVECQAGRVCHREDYFWIDELSTVCHEVGPTDDVHIKLGELSAGANAAILDQTSLEIKLHYQDKTVEVCYDKPVKTDPPCDMHSIWPFDAEGVGMKNPTIDIVPCPGEMWCIYVNGKSSAPLQVRRIEGHFPDEVEISLCPPNADCTVRKINAVKVHDYDKISYLYQNPCVPHAPIGVVPIQKMSIDFMMKYLPNPQWENDNQFIYSEIGAFDLVHSLYLHQKRLKFRIPNNGPTEIIFDFIFEPRDPITGKPKYHVIVFYSEIEKVVELYVDAVRVQIVPYNNAQTISTIQGWVGCFSRAIDSDKEGDFHGQIWDFAVTHDAPEIRAAQAPCTETTCTPPRYKPHQNYGTLKCLGPICDRGPNGEDLTKMTPNDQDQCCQEMPFCTTNFLICTDSTIENPCFACGAAAAYLPNATSIYCEDTLCSQGDNSLCCANKTKCNSLACHPGYEHREQSHLIPCDQLIVRDCDLTQDHDTCCEEVKNCSTHVCPSGMVLIPFAMDIRCTNKTCTDVDTAHCCAHEGKCSMMLHDCPLENYILKPNAHEINCDDQHCSATNFEKCCALRGRCDSHECPRGKILTGAATDSWCDGRSCVTGHSVDDDKCCTDPAPCEQYDNCGSDYVNVNQILGQSINCAGRECEETDHSACCARKATCDTKTCPSHLSPFLNDGEINCATTDCDTTPDYWCCGEDASCSKFDCRSHGNFVRKLEANTLHCDDYQCTSNDLGKCCETTESCNQLECPVSMADHPEKDSRFCDNRKCELSDKVVCCVPKVSCLEHTCGKKNSTSDMVYRHNAAHHLCNGQNCSTTPDDTCCVHKSSCAAYTCDTWSGYIHKPNYGELKCNTPEGFSEPVCTTGDCCDERSTCASYFCPRPYTKRRNVASLFCAGGQCNDADLHMCCQMEGFCINRTCPLGMLHKPDAHETLCDDRACDPLVTPEEKCCAQSGQCTSFRCPKGMLLKLNASLETCTDFICNEDDIPKCCNEAPTCSHHECESHMTLRADHSNWTCANYNCTAEDHDTCCVPKGHCKTKLCSPGRVHRQIPDLFCKDPSDNCESTEENVCCEDQKNCVTYTCPKGYVHKKPTTPLDAPAFICAGPVCTDEDRETCCEAKAFCDSTSMVCPATMVPKVHFMNHHTDFQCPEAECTTHDRLTCCTFSDRCDSMHCPPGTLHRHDAYHTSCDGYACDYSTDSAHCCVDEGNCFSYHCPEGFVHRHNSTKLYCEDWLCKEGDRDTCCIERAPCNELNCADPDITARQADTFHLVKRWDAEDHLCVNFTCNVSSLKDEEECCVHTKFCASRACPPGELHRQNAHKLEHGIEGIHCEDENCTNTADAVCCAPQDMCHSSNCPVGYVHRANADTERCEGFICDENDYETCCIHVEWCNAMTCPTGMVHRPDAAGRMCEAEHCTDADDSTQCCDYTANCGNSGKVCPTSMALKPAIVANNLLCYTDSACRNVEEEYCCRPKPHCKTKHCPPGWTHVDDVVMHYCNGINATGGLECDDNDMKSTCCLPRAPCTNYQNSGLLPLGYYLKGDAAERLCQGSRCSDHDLHECAGESGYCPLFNCSAGYVHRHDAKHIPCPDRDCYNTVEEHCCLRDEDCLTFPCKEGFVHQQNNVTCLTDKCDPHSDVDHLRCCVEAQKCDELLSCGADYALRETPHAIPCIHHPESLTCNLTLDLHTCCVSDGMCASYPCSDGNIHRHDSHLVGCVDENCTLTEEALCCTSIGTCASYHCPPPMVHKTNSSAIPCRDHECTDADKYYCCDVADTCDNMACPVGLVWKADIQTLICGGVDCEQTRDKSTCCEVPAQSTCDDDTYCVAEAGSKCKNAVHGTYDLKCMTSSVASGWDRGINVVKPLAGECFMENKQTPFPECMTVPGCTNFTPDGAAWDEYCCDGQLLKHCEPQAVAQAQIVSIKQTPAPEAKQVAVGNATTTLIFGGACFGSTGCSVLFEDGRMLALFIGGISALAPLFLV